MPVLEVFGGEGGRPCGATESTVVEAGVVLITGEVAILTERGDVEPVAVGVEVILGEIFVPFDAILCAEFVRLRPGFGFDTEQFNVAGIIIALD